MKKVKKVKIAVYGFFLIGVISIVWTATRPMSVDKAHKEYIQKIKSKK